MATSETLKKCFLLCPQPFRFGWKVSNYETQETTPEKENSSFLLSLSLLLSSLLVLFDFFKLNEEGKKRRFFSPSRTERWYILKLGTHPQKHFEWKTNYKITEKIFMEYCFSLTFYKRHICGFYWLVLGHINKTLCFFCTTFCKCNFIFCVWKYNSFFFLKK